MSNEQREQPLVARGAPCRISLDGMESLDSVADMWHNPNVAMVGISGRQSGGNQQGSFGTSSI